MPEHKQKHVLVCCARTVDMRIACMVNNGQGLIIARGMHRFKHELIDTNYYYKYMYTPQAEMHTTIYRSMYF